MTFLRYVQDKMILILLNVIFDCVAGLLLFLYGCNIPFILTIWIFRLITFTVYLTVDYYRLLKRKNYCDGIIKSLDKTYMICDVLSKPENIEEEIYFEMLKAACKSLNDEAAKCKRSQTEYKDRIEEWVHEMKNPVSAIKLLCFNHPAGVTKEIDSEIKSIDALLEKVLYYARSESLEQDYFIRRFRLSDVIHSALLQYRSILLSCGFAIEVTAADSYVYSDEKWISFILGQLISNAVKYRNDTNPKLGFIIDRKEQNTWLIVEDNGCGISQADLPRIFDRGFTGSDRKKSGATGIGLYICKKLCDKMGLEISAESEKGPLTKIKIRFSYGQLTEL